MPEAYNYEILKEEILNRMSDFEEKEERITDILKMVDKALYEISEYRARREAEEKN